MGVYRYTALIEASHKIWSGTRLVRCSIGQLPANIYGYSLASGCRHPAGMLVYVAYRVDYVSCMRVVQLYVLMDCHLLL